jgi:hypothetical protein
MVLRRKSICSAKSPGRRRWGMAPNSLLRSQWFSWAVLPRTSQFIAGVVAQEVDGGRYVDGMLIGLDGLPDEPKCQLFVPVSCR